MGYDLDENVRTGAGRSRRRDNGMNRERPAGRQSTKRTPSGGPSAPRKKKKSKTRRRIITMIIAECFALIVIFGYGFVARRWNMIQRIEDWTPEEVENPNFSVDLPQYQKQKGHWGIYIFGVDSRGSNVGKGTNADVNMICDINHDTGEIRLVSVFRDSYLNVNESGSYNKINQAYFTGGPSNAAKMLNKNLDLNVGDFVTFNWKAVADGINILGGVDMEISNAEFYYINSFITETVEATGVYSTHLKKAGMNHLDGVQAVAYGRLRLMDTDFARTERQRKVIQAAFEKAKKADFATLNQLTLTLFPQVATSVDMQDIISLLGDVGKYYIGETGGFPFARGDANMGKKGACVIPQTLESNVKELHQFLYGEENYVPSNTVKQISAKISSDTGMYTQGVSVGHVSTTGGAIPNPAKVPAESAVKETKKGGKEDSEEASSKESKESEEKETDKKKESESEKESEKEKESERESEKESERESEEESTKANSSPSKSETRPAATAPAAERPGGNSHDTPPGDRTDNRPVNEPTAARPDTSSDLKPVGGDGPGTGDNRETTAASVPGSPGGQTASQPVTPGGTGGPGSDPAPSPGNSGSPGSTAAPNPSGSNPSSPGAQGAGPQSSESGVTTIPAGPNIS